MAMQEMSYDGITERCLELLDAKELTALELLEELMNTPGVPMHDPVHHYIMPAMLLTMAARSVGMDREALKKKLNTAEERARKVLPGFCGWWGSCGSSVGCGIFASVWLEAGPKKEEHWATCNALTSKCLAEVSSVGGPRCCKRTCYLALRAAVREAPALLGVDLGPEPSPVCTWSAFNQECRREACPFYAASVVAEGAKAHRHLFAVKLG